MKRTLLTILLLFFLYSPSHAWTSFYSTGGQGRSEEVSAQIISKVFSSNPIDLQFEVLNYDTSADRQVMCFDAVALPSNTAIPYITFSLPKGTATLPGIANPLPFRSVQLTKGLVCGCSTAITTLTIDTSAKCFFQVSVQ